MGLAISVSQAEDDGARPLQGGDLWSLDDSAGLLNPDLHKNPILQLLLN